MNFELQKDDFNSEIFGIYMGNLKYSDDLNVTAVLRQAKQDFVEHITIKVPTTDKKTANLCFQEGFLLADTLINYCFALNTNELIHITHKCTIREYNEKDLAQIMTIARNSFKIDRFHSDPSLDNTLCDKYYEQWIYNSCNGFADIVLVAEYNNEVVGFTTGKIEQDGEDIHLVLSAVSDKYRGLGIYTSMIYSGMEWAKQFDKKRLIVGTQIDNIAVQKAWIKLGFRVLSSEYVLQKKLV